MVFYLKYRPQTLSDLIGQESVKKTLVSALQNNKLAHAFLFVGPQGTGKTSTARILAKMVNCESVDRQCNKCATCMSITDGSNLDLMEIDAASNRGIEDIRTLRDNIKLAPSNSRKKIYIIDEVHMLTTEAFNALLKILEEPPDHVLFILATTHAQKIPLTIMSRVQRLDFRLATPSELGQVLENIAKKEKIDIDEEALQILIKKADGSFRDGVKLLDQVSSIGGKITKEFLEKFFRASQFENLLKLVEVLGEKDAKTGLILVSKEIEMGVDVKELILNLMDVLRNIVFIKNGLGQLVSENYSEDNYRGLVKVSASFTNQDLIQILDSLQKALEQMKVVSIPSLPLELAVVEICGGETNKKLNTGGKKMDEEVGSLKTVNPPSNRQHLTSKQDEINGSEDILKLKEKWTFVLETVRSYNFSLEALLRSIKIVECNNTSVVMAVPYSFHQRILEVPKNRDLLESIISDILGRSIRISTVLEERRPRKEDVVNIEVAQDDEIIRAAAEIFNSDTIN